MSNVVSPFLFGATSSQTMQLAFPGERPWLRRPRRRSGGLQGPTLLFTVTVSYWWFGTFFIFPYIENNNPN